MRLKAENLAVERGGRQVFADVAFEVAGGGLMTVTGPNGAGKSTLLRTIAGLLVPAEGTITLDPAADGPRGTAMHYLGHLDGLKNALTVRENLDFWRRVCGPTGLEPIDALEEV